MDNTQNKYILLETTQYDETKEFLAICQIEKLTATVHIKNGNFEFTFSNSDLRKIRGRSIYLAELIDNNVYTIIEKL